VSQVKSPTIVTVRLASTTRWLLLLPALCALLISWFVVRWYVGNTLAEYSPTVENGGIDMARVATRWAPGDPFTHWRVASLEDKVFSAANLADAAREYQLAVTLSPYDYRYWMELGRALEATGDVASGEKALKRAVDLAPAYSHPRWHYGNLLLRAGKQDEAFVQLALAAKSDDQMRPPVFGLAWGVFDGDVDKIAAAACPFIPVRMEFATYLVGLSKVEEAMRVWRTISPADRKTESVLGEEFKTALMKSRHFRPLLEVTQATDPDADGPAPEQIWNGDFERDLQSTSAKYFYWIINSRPAARIGGDSTAHSGKGSLRIIFKSTDKLETVGVAQTIVITPDAHYRFEGYLRTEDLISGGMPVISILDATNEAVLVSSPPAPSGTNDWQKITLDFKTGVRSDGIIVKVTRARCAEQEQVCPLFGTIWYDDFSLKRVGSSGVARGSATSGKP
jgi:hypothetical protein